MRRMVRWYTSGVFESRDPQTRREGYLVLAAGATFCAAVLALVLP